MVNQKMSKDVDKSGQLGESKSITRVRCGDLFERRFYTNVGFMWRAHSVYPNVASGTFEQCCITSGGGS
jgi:hypothetical protein